MICERVGIWLTSFGCSEANFEPRVTDVERQPFRSMGFVSVIIVSVLFALGLPLVLV